MSNNKDKEPKKVETFMDGFKKLLTETFGTKQNFAEAKLKDGTVIAYEGDVLAEGLEVWVIPSDGSEKLPAPDGVHTLEDGTQIEVVDGKVVKVAPAMEMNTENTAAPSNVPATEAAAKRVVESIIKETVFSKDEVTAKVKEVTDAFETFKSETSDSLSAMKSENEALTKQLAEAKAANEAVSAKFSKFVEETTKLITDFGATPQVKTEPEKKEFREEKKSVVPSMDEFRSKYIKQ